MFFLNNEIKCDLYRYTGSINFLNFLKIYLQTPAFRYLYFYRRTNNLKRYSFLWYYYSIILKSLSFKYGIQIPSTTKIGLGFYIGHFGTIVINEKSIIGDNCNIAHNVTIGEISIGTKRGCPKICNSVWIGTGSVIVGNVTIGDNVIIAPNSYVNFTVPTNCIVIGNPAKIVSNTNFINDYILNKIS